MTRFLVPWLGGAAALALAVLPASAQQSSSAPGGAPGFVPQPTPIADRLATAMQTLANKPTDLDALIAAGEASAMLDDGPAALQFLARAEKVRADDPRIAAARGRAYVHMGRPGEALRHFAQAERAGLSPTGYADDRGLAYDLVGDQAHAQAEYVRAMAAEDTAETRRRYAVSLAISGDAAGADRVLDPLLRQQDRAAWRTRALVMALTGKTNDAERVTATMMPGFSTAYLPLFRRLAEIRDPADRAFAAHLGEFTRTPARLADARLAPPAPSLPGSATAVQVAALPNAGEDRAEQPTRTASSATRNYAAERRAEQQRAEREAYLRERQGRRPQRTAPSRTATASLAPAADPVTARSAPALTRAPVAATPAPAVVATPTPTPSPPPANEVLAAIVRNIAIPAAELGVAPPLAPVIEAPAPRPEPTPVAATPAPRAAAPSKPEVKPEAAKPKPKRAEAKKPEPKKAEPKKPVEPARWWVQVAGGANVGDLPKAWSALAAKSSALKGRQAWTFPVRATNRLLTGPFKSASEAQAFVNTLAKGGLSAFSVQSEAGQKVSRLPTK